MKPSELFGVLTRGFGVYVFMHGLYDVAYAVLIRIGAFPNPPLENRDYAGEFLVRGITWLAGSVLLLRFASWFVIFSYPADRDADSGESISVP